VARPRQGARGVRRLNDRGAAGRRFAAARPNGRRR
jgi:hypothetical protein